MNTMRTRAKEHFPTVLLTLLSIVQALALELLWGHVVATGYLYSLSWMSALAWLQITATFVGLVLVWVVYASNVTRFIWVPSTSDSVLPFMIGVLEFMLVETLGPDEVGQWLICMAVIFAGMQWIGHSTMRRAREDDANAAFFAGRPRAGWNDFYAAASVVLVLAAAGVYEWLGAGPGTFTFIALTGTLILLSWQYYQSVIFWNRSVQEE